MEIEFVKPVYLFFLVIIPILIFIHFYSLKYGRKQALKFANFEAIRRVTGETVVTKNVLLLIMRLVIVLSLILAASGTIVWYTGTSMDYDMVLAIDASSSMLAEDYKPDRFTATKSAMLLFLDNLPGKVKVGLVSFSGASFINHIPSYDINAVKDAVRTLEIQKLGGTDLGSAIITSANILLDDKPKVIVLLTDGQSNIGIPTDDALDYIKDYKITVHTIGIGTSEGGLISDIGAAFRLDEETLKDIAAKTSGQYFRPVDEQSLRDAFTQISQFEQRPVRLDISIYLLVISLALLMAEWGLIGTKYKII